MSDQKAAAKSGISIGKILRWVVLGAMLLVIVLMLKTPRPVADSMPPGAAKERSEQVQIKLAELATAHQRGEASEARFSSDEINGVLQQAQREQSGPNPQPAGSLQKTTEAADPMPEVSTTRIAFVGDEATGQFVVHAPGGKEVVLTISGKIRAVDGYASFEFTEGKIGDMPVPVSLLNSRLQAKLQEPETRPRLKLPDYVADIRVENGELVMREK